MEAKDLEGCPLLLTQSEKVEVFDEKGLSSLDLILTQPRLCEDAFGAGRQRIGRWPTIWTRLTLSTRIQQQRCCCNTLRWCL